MSEARNGVRRGRRGTAPLLAFCLALSACGGGEAARLEREEQARLHYRLAYGYYFDEKSPNGDAALQEILRSIELNPDDADARLLAGLIFMGRGRYLDAVLQFKTALELRPGFHFALNNLGATYLAMERWDDAIEIFDKLVADITYRTPGHAHNNLGWAWYQKGEHEKAERHYRLAMNLAPKLCPPYNNLAMLLIERGELASAEKFVERGLKRCPNYAELHYHMGRIEARRARLVEARDRFKRCMDLSGDSPLAERCESHLSALGAGGPW